MTSHAYLKQTDGELGMNFSSNPQAEVMMYTFCISDEINQFIQEI
jgi:hypothetical protein